MARLEAVAASASCERFRLLQQFCDFALQREQLVIPKIGEVERLQITLLRRHRKQHSRLASYPVRTQVNGQVDAETFVKALCYFKQSSGSRNPQSSGPELLSVF